MNNAKIFIYTGLLITNLSLLAQPYKIVDTGQEKCFDNHREIQAPQKGEAFYGQDAQYNGNQPGYTVSNDELTVLDRVTGLT